MKTSNKKKSSLSQKEQEICDKLRPIWNNKNYMDGIIFTIKGDQEAQRIIDYIDSDEWELPSDILVEALFIKRDREIAKSKNQSSK